ncbi:unnamed protein product [Musa acuminata subsp. burmannicoides]
MPLTSAATKLLKMRKGVPQIERWLRYLSKTNVQVIKGQHNENEVKQANYHYNKAKNLPLVGYPHDAEISLREGAKTAVLSWK